MFPVRDLNPTRRFPILTYGLIAINVVVFLWEMTLSQAQLERAFFDLSVVPATLTQSPWSMESILDVVRSMFLHGGYEHILGNMLYLWLFGDNIEDRLGKLLFLVLYFASGFAAAFAQVAIDPNSAIPLVGASGAIAGVLGSYALLFPGIRVRGVVLLGRVSQLAEWPAYVVLGSWFLLQLLNGIASLGVETASGSVAFFAHIGGFLVGLALTAIFMQLVSQPPAQQRNQMLYRRSQRQY
ncbi:MAG: rhomboid family intramembrane serine protease [Chloroflexi bacterium]|nr:rhomboid family intramembrane serine protease [Chloroflexota bacterium]